MSEKYFAKFPLISYNGTPVVNITERAVVRDNPSKNAYIYYPFDLQNDERPDQLADQYLNDEYMDWIIYLTNGILDPYYDWYMSDYEFAAFIKGKYGSLQAAQTKIKCWRND